ncbi:MAG: aminopeptidase [Bacteroidia bacterium]
MYTLLISFVVLVAFNFGLLVYGIEQAAGQIKIVWKAKPVEKFINDPDFPDSLKQKLLLIQEVREFAIDSLGINNSKNYTTLYDQQGKPAILVVTACKPYAFEPVEWDFPFLGRFSYKGFFNFDRARKERDMWLKEGYDTELSPVTAWSTLGWFKDPVLTGMLRRSTGELAELIIHELTHATLYVKSSVEYNENLATFVGEEGAKIFLRHKYGEGSKEYTDYLHILDDEVIYGKHILVGYERLDSLYKTFDDETPLAVKDTLKKQMISKIISEIGDIGLHLPENYSRIMSGKYVPNNTYFVSYRTYRAEQNTFQKEFSERFNSNFREYLGYLKETYPSL